MHAVFPPQPGNMLLSDSGEELILMDLGSARDAAVSIRNRSVAFSLNVSTTTALSLPTYILLIQTRSSVLPRSVCSNMYQLL